MEHEFEISPYDGIARFKVDVPPADAGAGLARIVVTAGKQRSEPLPVPRRGGQVLVGVHTHFLRDGAHRLDFSVIVAGEARLTGSIGVEVRNSGPIAQEVAAALQRHHSPFAFVGDCDASRYPYEDPVAIPWFDRPDAMRQIDARQSGGSLTNEDAAMLRQFVEHGYVKLEGLIDDELVGAVNREIDEAVRDGHQGYVYGSSQRIELLHLHKPNIRRLWLDERHLRITNMIFGAKARPCQTLTYLFGSQQDPHQDTIHLTPFPAGYMCGTWVALQDVAPDSGELVVFPGSHREPRVRMHSSGCAKVRDGDWSEFGAKIVPAWTRMSERYEPMVYRPRKGTVLIWHENLLHGGSVRRDQSLERRSLVIHSFAEGAIVYYDSTGNVGRTVDPEDARMRA